MLIDRSIVKIKMRRIIPIIIGAILLLVGIGWASQGAGLMSGISLMNNNPAFIYLGSFLAVVGIAVIAYGAISKKKVQTTASMEQSGSRVMSGQ
jgi:hypothetical protein